MIIRIISSIVALPFLILIVLLGGIYLRTGIAAVSLIALYEFYTAVDKKFRIEHLIGYIFSLLYIFTMDSFLLLDFKIFLSLFVIILFLVKISKNDQININNIATVLIGFFYTTFMFSNIYLVWDSPLGKYTVWLIFISAWACDTGAYFVGVNFGKHKLAPVLSPKKSVEGSIGGVVITGLVSALYGYFVSNIFPAPNSDINFILLFSIIGVIGSIFAQLGDLAASSIKRETNIKDFGKIMPGHGGVLDRFDSIIFTSTITWWLLNIYM